MRQRSLGLTLALAATSLLATPALASWVPRWVTHSVFSIDAGPKAPPALDLSRLPEEPGAAKLCAPARERLGCDEAGAGDCSCAVRVFYAHPPDAPSGPNDIVQAALVDAHNRYAPGRTQDLALAVRTIASGWHQVAALGTGEVGGMGTRLRSSADVLHLGGRDFADQGRWVWVDVMQNHASPDEGTHWTRNLWLCGGAVGVVCNAVPLERWFTASFEGTVPDKAATPKATGSLFAFAATLDRGGVLNMAAKTKVPRWLRPLMGRHRLDQLDALLSAR